MSTVHLPAGDDRDQSDALVVRLSSDPDGVVVQLRVRGCWDRRL